ncbi:MAG: hypothetical protein C5B50_05615 [Verrucomicrobia bacterium]|nr:MAG: hypothetical protein C5B50_05615 [Verrucomicrobiota bacterium]
MATQNSMTALTRQVPPKPSVSPPSNLARITNYQDLVKIEECVRYYPPNLEPVSNGVEIFSAIGESRDREIDLFVDVPYCGTICGFCPFNVYRYKEEEALRYIDSLEKEIRAIRSLNDLTRTRVRTVWVGGGTPTRLSIASMNRLLELLDTNFDLRTVVEFTMEIKPTQSDLVEEKFDLFRQYGVTRISMGVQSTEQKQLEILGRGHTAKDALEVVDKIMGAGFPLNIDMMYRLPGQKHKEVEQDLENVRSLGIDHMSWFPYVPHQGTRLASRISNQQVAKPADREQYFAMFETVLERLSLAGYDQYTPYHFAKSRRCDYHVDRWKMPQLETLGLGPGAFSFFNGNIYTNEHDPAKYAKMVNENVPPVVLAKKLTQTERTSRLAVLGVKFFGLELSKFETLTGEIFTNYYKKETDLLTRAGLVELKADCLECTIAGRAFNNDVATAFATDVARRTKHPQALDLMRR